MAICIVLNGPSAVGKSTLVTGLQDRSPVPLLRFGADELYRMVPPQWAGGTPDAAHADRGFRYVDAVDAQGRSLGRELANGPDAVAMLHAMNAGVLGMLGSGHHVVVDGQAYEPAVTDELHRRLRESVAAGRIEATIIELTAEDPALLDRQHRHRHPAGLAIAQARRGWICADPDLQLNTTELTAEQLLDRAWEALRTRHPVLTRNPPESAR